MTPPANSSEVAAGSDDSLKPELFIPAEATLEQIEPDHGRSDFRLPLDVQVTIQGPGHMVTASTRDISLSGLFVQSSEMFPVGTVCEVRLTAAEGMLTIFGKATVMRQVIDEETGFPG